MGKGAASAFVPILAGVGIGVATGNPMMGFMAAGASSSAMAGFQGMAAAQTEEAQIKAQAEEARVAGEQRANEIRQQLAATLGTQAALFGSRGVALGSGGPDALAEATRRQFDDALRVNRLNILTNRERSRLAVHSARIGGTASLLEGLGGAAMIGFTGMQAMGSLGSVPQPGQVSRSPARSSPPGRGPYLRRG